MSDSIPNKDPKVGESELLTFTLPFGEYERGKGVPLQGQWEWEQTKMAGPGTYKDGNGKPNRTAVEGSLYASPEVEKQWG